MIATGRKTVVVLMADTDVGLPVRATAGGQEPNLTNERIAPEQLSHVQPGSSCPPLMSPLGQAWGQSGRGAGPGLRANRQRHAKFD